MFRQKLQRFFYGRNGQDQLGFFLMVLILIFSLINNPVRTNSETDLNWINPVCSIINWALLAWVVFRMFSKNLQQRRKENMAFMKIWNAVKRPFIKAKARYNERKFYRVFSCPKCKQKLRVPKYKGAVKVRCTKCGEVFIRKT